jgi:hypothetical protein
MELNGRIIAVLPVQTGQGRNGEWKKQEYVLEYNTDSQYPKRMCFNLWGEKVDQFNIREGQNLTVSFDIDCREYQGRWYNDIRAWKVIEQQGGIPVADLQAPFSGQQMPPPFTPQDVPAANGNAADDLPF